MFLLRDCAVQSSRASSEICSGTELILLGNMVSLLFVFGGLSSSSSKESLSQYFKKIFKEKPICLMKLHKALFFILNKLSEFS